MDGEISGKIKLSAPLREAAGSAEVRWELSQGATVAALIEYLKKRFPGLRQSIDHTLILVNGRYAALENSLKDGDEVTILPIIGGG